jgi:hypothetical protein
VFDEVNGLEDGIRFIGGDLADKWHLLSGFEESIGLSE